MLIVDLACQEFTVLWICSLKLQRNSKERFLLKGLGDYLFLEQDCLITVVNLFRSDKELAEKFTKFKRPK